MNKNEKIASLSTAMTTSVRRDNPEETFHHFTDEAPKELRDLYLEHYEIEDIDYETFSRACDIVSEIYTDKPDITQDAADEKIYEIAGYGTASVYTSTRLSYLDVNNEGDISDLMSEYGLTSIADACAAWYDRQVEQAAILINDWLYKD